MDDLKQVAEQKEVEETTQTTPPVVEAPSTEEQTQTTDATVSATTDDFPEDVEGQRRAFQEQRLEIKRLKDERKARSKNESAFSAFRPPVNQVNLAQQIRTEDFTDPITGEINRPAYNAALHAESARQASVRAEQSVAEQIDEYKARERHPELFADPEIEDEIASKWLFRKWKGENVTVSDIADSIAKKYSKAVSKAEKSGAEKALQEVTEKEQAALQANTQTSSQSRTQQSQADMERLRELTRRGGDTGVDAIAARMNSIPWANK